MRKKTNETKSQTKSRTRGKSKTGSKANETTNTRKPNNVREKEYDDSRIDPKSRENNPMWYFLDEKVGEQVSQLSFQQLGGMRVNLQDGVVNTSVGYPVIHAQYWNPSPGVQEVANFSGGQAANAAINLAGFRLFTKLAAYTGRTQTYGPQDLSLMILSMGELISCFEWIRRAFGIAFINSERTRAYPRQLLKSMHIDDDDFYINYQSYRIRFNKAVTLVNQLPIPKSIAYFEKCASKYERIYVDSPSPMSTIIVDNPATTWELDETSYLGGTKLATTPWCFDTIDNVYPTANLLMPLSVFLGNLERMINLMLSSSTLNVVYTDILNLASKMSVEFWKMDYLMEGYVAPVEYNPAYLLQYHNETYGANPVDIKNDSYLGTLGVTPYNDVYPNQSNNNLYYNPGLPVLRDASNNPVVWGITDALIDSIVESPTWEDRIEMTRMITLTPGGLLNYSGTDYVTYNCILPDHYLVASEYFDYTSTPFQRRSSKHIDNATNWPQYAGLVSKIDWHPLIYAYNNANGLLTGDVVGDLNYFTSLTPDWLKKVNEFVGFGLYDVRLK